MRLAISVLGGNDLWRVALLNGDMDLMTETASAELKLFGSWWNREYVNAKP